MHHVRQTYGPAPQSLGVFGGGKPRGPPYVGRRGLRRAPGRQGLEGGGLGKERRDLGQTRPIFRWRLCQRVQAPHPGGQEERVLPFHLHEEPPIRRQYNGETQGEGGRFRRAPVPELQRGDMRRGDDERILLQGREAVHPRKEMRTSSGDGQILCDGEVRCGGGGVLPGGSTWFRRMFRHQLRPGHNAGGIHRRRRVP